MQTVSVLLNSLKRLGAGRISLHVSYNRAQLRLSPILSWLRLTASLLGPIFGPLLSLDTHALRVDISPRGIWQLYTAVYEGPVSESQGSKTVLFAILTNFNYSHLYLLGYRKM